jgi:hypothetical protein
MSEQCEVLCRTTLVDGGDVRPDWMSDIERVAKMMVAGMPPGTELVGVQEWNDHNYEGRGYYPLNYHFVLAFTKCSRADIRARVEASSKGLGSGISVTCLFPEDERKTDGPQTTEQWLQFCEADFEKIASVENVYGIVNERYDHFSTIRTVPSVRELLESEKGEKKARNSSGELLLVENDRVAPALGEVA